MIKKIDHINLVVEDLEQCKHFFAFLDFKETNHAFLEGEWFECTVGIKGAKAEYFQLAHTNCETSLEIIRYLEPKDQTFCSNSIANKKGIRHFAFEVEDIENWITKLKNNGVQFLSGLQINPRTGKKIVYFEGPEGILLELAEFPKNNTYGN